MNKSQVMAFEIIQTLVERILEIQEEHEEDLELMIHAELIKLLDKEEDEEDEPSTAPKVNKTKLPKNWGKVNGVKF